MENWRGNQRVKFIQGGGGAGEEGKTNNSSQVSEHYRDNSCSRKLGTKEFCVTRD